MTHSVHYSVFFKYNYKKNHKLSIPGEIELRKKRDIENQPRSPVSERDWLKFQ